MPDTTIDIVQELAANMAASLVMMGAHADQSSVAAYRAHVYGRATGQATDG